MQGRAARALLEGRALARLDPLLAAWQHEWQAGRPAATLQQARPFLSGLWASLQPSREPEAPPASSSGSGGSSGEKGPSGGPPSQQGPRSQAEAPPVKLTELQELLAHYRLNLRQLSSVAVAKLKGRAHTRRQASAHDAAIQSLPGPGAQQPAPATPGGGSQAPSATLQQPQQEGQGQGQGSDEGLRSPQGCATLAALGEVARGLERRNRAPSEAFLLQLSERLLWLTTSEEREGLPQGPARAVSKAATAQAERQEGPAAGQAVASTLHCLAYYGQRPANEQLKAIADSLAGRVADFRPHGLTALTDAMAVMGHSSLQLLTATADHVIARMPAFTAGQLSDIAYSFAMLDYHSVRFCDALLQHLLKGLQRVPPAALVQTLEALATIGTGSYLTDVFLLAANDAVEESFQAFSAPQLAGALWAFSKLGHWRNTDTQLLQAITCALEATGCQGLNPGRLVKLGEGLAAANFYNHHTAALLDAACGRAVETLDRFSAEQVVKLAVAAGQLRHYSGPLFAAVADKACAELDLFSPSQLADLLLVLAEVGHERQEGLGAVAARVLGAAETLDAGTLCDALWGLGALGLLSGDAFCAICGHLAEQPLDNFAPKDFERLYHAQLMLAAEYALGGRPDPPQVPGWVGDYALRTWTDKMYHERHTSPWQEGVLRALTDLGLPFSVAVNPEAAVANIDVHVYSQARPRGLDKRAGPDELPVALRLEGPNKYTVSRPHRPLGDTLVARRLLEAEGHRVAVVGKAEWKGLSAEGRKAVLQQRIAEALARPHRGPSRGAAAERGEAEEEDEEELALRESY